MLYRIRPRRHERRRGSAAVEFGVTLPLLAALLMGIWEVGRFVDVQQLMQNAAREGGRQASTGTKTAAEVQQLVRNYLERNDIPADGIAVTVENITSSSRPEPNTANQLDRFRVTVRIPFDDVRWAVLSQITQTRTLTATSDWFSMKDTPLSVSTTIPIE